MSPWPKNWPPSRPRERLTAWCSQKKVDSRDAHLRELRRLVERSPGD